VFPQIRLGQIDQLLKSVVFMELHQKQRNWWKKQCHATIKKNARLTEIDESR
jgi:hypothetical protein